MGYIVNTRGSAFFEELPEEKRKEYFNLKQNNFIPAIDNIYYTIFLDDDKSDNPLLYGLFERLEELRNLFLLTHIEQELFNGLYVKSKGHSKYRFCLTVENEYDIYIADYLPNEETPRIFVQLRAYGLWNFGVDSMLAASYKAVEGLFVDQLGCTIKGCRENRIDYCYHTNIMVNPTKTLDRKYLEKYMHTTFTKGQEVWRMEKHDSQLSIFTEYLGMGNRKSNNLYARFYDKTKEVIDKGYKGMFFKIWFDNGLINQYDKFCYEYAYSSGSYDNVHKAKLYFYMSYGTDIKKKRDIAKVLKDKNNTCYHFRAAAKEQGLPELTVVMNVEYQTMRKFYSYSDKIIDQLSVKEREEMPSQLNRILKIVDNRGLFIDYLTSKTVCFKKSEDKYCTWWDRLRNTKLDCFKHDEKLVRDYSTELDKQSSKRRLIGSVATDAVYNDNIDTDFGSDLEDMLTSFNDNDRHDLDIKINGEFDSFLLRDYSVKKQNKEIRLRSRKRKFKDKQQQQEDKQRFNDNLIEEKFQGLNIKYKLSKRKIRFRSKKRGFVEEKQLSLGKIKIKFRSRLLKLNAKYQLQENEQKER